MIDRVGEVWSADDACFYVVVARREHPGMEGGWVWELRSLYEHGWEGKLPIGRSVYVVEQYLLVHMDPVLTER